MDVGSASEQGIVMHPKPAIRNSVKMSHLRVSIAHLLRGCGDTNPAASLLDPGASAVA